MVEVNVEKRVWARLEKFVQHEAVASRAQLLALAAAVGLQKGAPEKAFPRAETVRVRVPEFAFWEVFCVLASARNPALVTKEDFVAELERYVAVGARVLAAGTAKTDFLSFCYELYKGLS